MADRSSSPIAIVGYSGRFPGAASPEALWQNVRAGVESVEDFSDADLDAAGIDATRRASASYVKRGPWLPGADRFDAGFFGFPPREAQLLDPQQRIFLELAWEALEDAGYGGDRGARSVAVYAGVGMNTYLITQVLADEQLFASAGGFQVMIGNDKDYLASRVAYKLDLHGPAVTIQTACSTSLTAVTTACRALAAGECDMALAGAVSVIFPQRAGYFFEEGMILSPDGHCRPFDADARGTIIGGGGGLVVLKTLRDAIADRDTIHAVIRGAALNNDGAAKAGFTAPSIEGQVEVIALAQALAGVDPRSISYIETHGTGTPLGDPIEIAALTQVFRAATSDIGFCRLGSIKANIGHLDTAAGIAGLIKTVLALEHREIPPLVNFRSPNPRLELESSPFVASASLSPWTADGPRRAGVSSFGIGGTNAHVVVEEAPPAPPSQAKRAAHVFVLSTKTETALDRAQDHLARHLDAHPEAALADVAWTLQVGRTALPHRRALVVRDRAHAIDVLRRSPGAVGLLEGRHEGGPRPVIFVFSGQGSQHLAMGHGLYESESVFRDAVDRCAVLLEPHLGVDIRDVIYRGSDASVLDETRLTQPALFVTSYALAQLWISWGVVPAAMIGHSIGEYVAAHLAGVFSLEDALGIVAARGRLMQALPAGSMATVHMSAADLGPLLAAIAPSVEIAATNAPLLTTVSGSREAIVALRAALDERGVESRVLRTSHAFHSAMMEPALPPFLEIVTRTARAAPRIPYASNLTGTWIRPEEATSPEYYAAHLRRAVAFEAGIRTVTADERSILLEVGPGNALTTLARLTLGQKGALRVTSSLPHVRDGRSDEAAVLETVARLWLAGVAVDWERFHTGEALRRVPLPTYPFESTRYWVDARPRVGSTSTPQASRAIEEWVYAPTWTRDRSGDEAAPRLKTAWLVLGGATPLREAVIRSVDAAGGNAVVVARGDDLDAAARAAANTFGGVAGAIDLSPIDRRTGMTEAVAEHGSVVALASALESAAGGAKIRIVLATIGRESVLDEPVRHHELAAVLGPVLVLPTEIPTLGTRAVDLDASSGPETAASQLVREATNDDAERVVAWRGRRRWVRRYEPTQLRPADDEALPLAPKGVYLVTGGLGGIGLVLARWLATRFSARLVLTARTELPARDRWDALLARDGESRAAAIVRSIREIEQAGGEVLVATADAADAAAMRAAIDAARARWGKIDGVIHAAGVSGTGTMAFRKQPAEVRDCLAPKIDGLEVLVDLLGDTPLAFVALMSSINAVIGAPGASDYAAANAVLDAFVDSAERPPGWRKVVSFDWGPWRDVGMAAARITSDKTGRALAFAISPSAGVDVFARVLASSHRSVVVAPFDLAAAIAQSGRGGPLDGGAGAESATTSLATPAAQHERPQLSTAYAEPSTETERALAAIWTELLGVTRIGADDDFFELGGHSLLATRVLSRIEERFGVRIPLRGVFDAPTIRGLALRTDEARAPGAAQDEQEGEREEVDF